MKRFDPYYKMSEQEINLALRISHLVNLKDKYGGNVTRGMVGVTSPGAYTDNKYGFYVEIDHDDVTIRFLDMYESDQPNLNFETLDKLSELFQSKRINLINSENVRLGCDTCGHNGMFGIGVQILNAKF